MLPRRRQQPIATKVFEIIGVSLVWRDGYNRLPAPCPSYGVDKLSRRGAFPMVYLGGGVLHDSDLSRCQPDHVQCQACSSLIDVTTLIIGVKAKDLDELLLSGFNLPELSAELTRTVLYPL